MGLRGLLGVELLDQAAGGFGQLGRRCLNSFLVVALECLFRLGNRRFDSRLLFLGRLVSGLFEGLFRRVHQTFTGVACGDQLLEPDIRLGIGLGICNHTFDLFIAQAAGGGNADGLLFASGLVLCRHVQDAVGIEVESHLDLRHTARCRRDIRQIETTQ